MIKKTILTILTITFLFNCTSVNKHNKQIEEEISVKKMEEDIDYAYKKLKIYNPKLFLYQSKEITEFKIDSLKKTLHTPLKPNEFYLKLIPLFSSLKHGHSGVSPMYKQLRKKEEKKYVKSKSALDKYNFLYKNDSIYLIKDSTTTNPIKSGAVLLSIDNISIDDFIKKYKQSIYGDGYNKTLSDNYFNRTFRKYITLEQGIKDSTELTFLDEGNIISKKTYREFFTKKDEKLKKDSINKTISKEAQRETRLKHNKYGYNKLTKTYSKELSFLTKDSSVAILSVKDFQKGKVKKLYKEAFKNIQKHKVENLILDLRNNGGGYLRDAHHLYAYLVDDSKQLVGKKTVASKTIYGKALFKMYPIMFYSEVLTQGAYGYIFTTKNSENEYDIHIPFSSAKINKKYVYHGNLYVIINGGSYSASAILASNLHAQKRAFFVGEETGGDYNGTAAGLMPKFKLPNSKLTMQAGIIFFNTIKQRDEKGHGIYPDKEIKQTFETIKQNEDPELEWIMNDIKNKKFKE